MEFKRICDLDIMFKQGSSQKSIICLHGYGANFYDLIPITSSVDPNNFYSWYFLNGIFDIDPTNESNGKSWFFLDESFFIDPSVEKYPKKSIKDLKFSTNSIINFLKEIREKYDEIFIGGFSQGSILALNTVLERPEFCKKLYLLSSTLINPNKIKDNIMGLKNIPIFQSHGKIDHVLPFESANQLNLIFSKDIDTYEFHAFQGQHEIPQDILKKLKIFFREITMIEGNILKMQVKLNQNKKENVQYHLPIGDSLLHMNPLIGEKIKIEFKGRINDIHNGDLIKKSYGQGHSYKSFISLPQCDLCIVQPEKCHFDKGTCRDPNWGEKNCFVPHYIYLAISGNTKIGITRSTQVPTRWIDQGASYATPILQVKNRKISGEIEIELAKSFSDKTNWRKMLLNEVVWEDLTLRREQIYNDFAEIFDYFEAEEIEEEITHINYPVLEYPKKIFSFNLEKNPLIEGSLMGIKGQYLIFDNGVINLRKYQGYYLSLIF